MESKAADNSGVTKGLMIGLLAGGALGAGMTLLYGPKPGRRLRAELRRTTGDIIDQGEEYPSTLQQRASDFVSGARRGLSHIFTDTEKEGSRSVKNAGGATQAGGEE